MSPIISGVDFADFDASDRSFEDAVTLPPAVYTSEEFFAFEMSAVFENEWICVGRVDQVREPGDFYTITLLGEPLIVARNFDGDVHVMSSVCQHRAMCVTAPAERPPEEWLELPPETKGNTRTFTCPYHWWKYDINGQLLGAPEMHRTNSFTRSEISLPHVRSEIWLGFIFINLSGTAEPLGPRLEPLEDVLRNWHVEEMVTVEPQVIKDLPFNWKVMVENFMEGYHPDRLHKDIHDFAPSSTINYATYEPGMNYMFGLHPTTVTDGGFNPTFHGFFPPIETLTEEERNRVNFAYVPPGLLFGFQSDSAFWFTVLPTSAGTHDLSMSYVFPKSTTEHPLFQRNLEMAVKGVEYFNNQDLPANTAVQMGLKSRFAPRGRYSWQESVLASFNSWLVEHYRAAAAESDIQVADPARR
jgi:phenylpropionate dioxygenase-like ring-hydroxylating dioxygenase large terminal subunit